MDAGLSQQQQTDTAAPQPARQPAVPTQQADGAPLALGGTAEQAARERSTHPQQVDGAPLALGTAVEQAARERSTPLRPADEAPLALGSTLEQAKRERSASPQPADEAPLALGLLRIGRARLALAVAVLREVIPRPAELSTLALPAAGLAGAVSLRGSVVPVLDLRGTLGLPPAAEPDGVIVVMRQGGKLLGLLASEVLGTTRVRPSQLQALAVATGGGTGIATHGFECDGGIATLLDAARIATLPGVPMVDEPLQAARTHHAGRREPVLLFDCCGMPLGIDAMCVEATVPPVVPKASPLARGACRGVIDHHGHEVPVVDTLELLGLGRSAAADARAVLVLRIRDGRLGLMLDNVRDIVRVNAAEILPTPALGLAQRALFRGVLPQGSDQHLLIDHGALEGQALLGALASMSRNAGTAARAAAAAGSAASGLPYLTYRVGAETATPLTQVSEILPYPEHMTALPQGAGGASGLFMHRGAAVPLVCLATLLGRPTATDPLTARVLVVETRRGRRVGLVVQALCSIETALWEAPGQDTGARRMKPLVEVGRGDARRTLPRLDLAQLVDAACAAAGDDAAEAPPAAAAEACAA